MINFLFHLQSLVLIKVKLMSAGGFSPLIDNIAEQEETTNFLASISADQFHQQWLWHQS